MKQAKFFQYSQKLLDQANACYQRPQYHFRAPCSWMNDVNGFIYYKGFFHLFYQANPVSMGWGPMWWGHAKSADLVHWEHLPLALAPDPIETLEQETCGVWSGNLVIKEEIPTIFYTSVGHNAPAKEGAEQCTATCDPQDMELIDWTKNPKNPVLTRRIHQQFNDEGELQYTEIQDWRDPFVWQQEDKWYMIIGGHYITHPKTHEPKNVPVVSLYKSSDFKKWEYLGPLCSGLDGSNAILGKIIPPPSATPSKQEKIPMGDNWECPNFFPLDPNHKKWCLLVGGPRVLANVGTWDNEKFSPEKWVYLDQSNRFYATNKLQQWNQETIIMGWIREGGTEGWSGSISLPRVIRLHESGNLIQVPHENLQQLRNHHITFKELKIQADSRISLKDFLSEENIPEFLRNSERRLEIIMEIKVPESTPLNDGAFGCTLYPPDQVQMGMNYDIGLDYEDQICYIGHTVANVSFRKIKKHTFHIFIDNSVIEVFWNNQDCITSRCFHTEAAIPELTFWAEEHDFTIKSLEIWTLKSIWG